MDQKICTLIGDVQRHGKIIGQGAYAVVEEGYKSDGIRCAVKLFHPKLLDTYKGKKYGKTMFEYEASVMSSLNHPNVVQFYGLHYGNDDPNNPPWLVMECLHTSLRSLITKQCLQSHVKVNILCDVAAGLKYLHSLCLVHCDLTPSNILITENLRAKIGDFGVSKFLYNATLTTQTPGTALYMSPEARQAIPSYNETLDIFSFGWVVIYTFSGTDPNETSYYNKKTEITQLSKPLQKLVEQCLHDEPQERPTASEVFTQLQSITDSDLNYTNDIKTSASSKQALSKANLSGSLHHNHPALVYSDGLLTSHCNSAPAQHVTCGLLNKSNSHSHNVSLTSSLSAFPQMSGSETEHEIENSLSEHTDLDIQRMVRSASTLTELFCTFSKHHAIQEVSSILDIQCAHQTIITAKVAYISTDTSLYTNKNYEIELRYKFDDVTSSRFCCEIKPKLSDTINLSQLQWSEFTIMLHKESGVRVGILHAEPLRKSNTAHSAFTTQCSSKFNDEAKLDNYMAVLLWISLQLYCLLYCFCQPTEESSPRSRGSKVDYHQVVEDSNSCIEADTNCGVIMTNGSNCGRTCTATYPSCFIMPFVSKQLMSKPSPLINLPCLLNIKVAMLSSINNLLPQYACSNTEIICLDNQIQSAGTTSASYIRAQVVAIVKLDLSPMGSLMLVCCGQRFCWYGEQYNFNVYTMHYTISISKVRNYLSKDGKHFISCTDTVIHLHLRQSSAQCYGPILYDCVADTQQIEMAFIQYFVLLKSFTLHLSTSKANKCIAHQTKIAMVSHVIHISLLSKLEMYTCTSQSNELSSTFIPECLLHQCLHRDSAHQGTLFAACAVGTSPVLEKVLFYWNNRRKLSVEFHNDVGDVHTILELNSTLLLPCASQLMSCHPWYDMTVNVAQQCFKSMYCNNTVCLKKQVTTMYGPSKVIQVRNTQERNTAAIPCHYLLLHTAFPGFVGMSSSSTMCMTVEQHKCQDDYDDASVGRLLSSTNRGICKVYNDNVMLKLRHHVVRKLLPTMNPNHAVAASNLTISNILQYFTFFSTQLHHINISLANYNLVIVIARYDAYYLTSFGICFLSGVAVLMKLHLRHLVVSLSLHQVAINNPTQSFNRYTIKGLNVFTEEQRGTELVNTLLVEMSGNMTPAILFKLMYMSKIPSCKEKSDIKLSKTVIAYVNTNGNFMARHYSVTTVVKSQLIALLHYMKQTLGQQHAGQLVSLTNRVVHSQATHLRNDKPALLSFLSSFQAVQCTSTEGRHQGCSSDVKVLTLGAPDLPSASKSVKICLCYSNKKITYAVWCLLTDDIHGTSLYNLVQTNWLISECAFYKLYANTPSTVAQQLATTCLKASDDDKPVVTKISANLIVYANTTKGCLAVEGNSLAVILNVLSRNHINSSCILHQESLCTSIFTRSKKLVCCKQHMCQVLPDCLLDLHNIDLSFIKIPPGNIYDLHENNCQPHKVSVTDDDAIQSGNTRMECNEVEPPVVFAKTKLTNLSVSIGQHLYFYNTLINQILTIEPVSGWQHVSHSELAVVYWHLQYLGLANIKLCLDKSTSSRNLLTTRGVYLKFTNGSSITTGSTLLHETRFSSSAACNSSLRLDAQWHCGKSAPLSFSCGPSVTNTVPNCHRFHAFNPQPAIPRNTSNVQTTTNPQRDLQPLQHLKPKPSHGVLMPPDVTANTYQKKHYRRNGSLVATKVLCGDVATGGINVIQLDQFVKSSFSICLLWSYKVGVVHRFSPTCLFTSSVKLMVFVLYRKTFEHRLVKNHVSSENWLGELFEAYTSPHRVHDLKLSTVKLSRLIVLSQLFIILSATQLGYVFQELLAYCLNSGKIVFDNTAKNFVAPYPLTVPEPNTSTLFGCLWLDCGKMIPFNVHFYLSISKQFSLIFSVSRNAEHLAIEFTSDLQTVLTVSMLTVITDHSLPEGLLKAVSSTYKSNSINIPLLDNTNVSHLVGDQLTISNSVRREVNKQHTVPPIVLPVKNISQQSLTVSDKCTNNLLTIGALIHEGVLDVAIGNYVVFGTYQSDQFVNIKHLADKWLMITHHRVYIDLVIKLNVVQQLVLCFATLFMAVTQIGWANVTSSPSHKYSSPNSTEHHNLEYLAYATIPEQLFRYVISVNFPVVRETNIVNSSGMSYHAQCSDIHNNNHMLGDGLAVTSILHCTTSRRILLQRSTEIDGKMAHNLQCCDADSGEVAILLSSRNNKFKVENTTYIMTQHFLCTPDKQQMCYAIFLAKIVCPHVNQYTRILKKTTLELYLIPRNRKLPLEYSKYLLGAAQYISMSVEDNRNDIGCFLVAESCEMIFDGPLRYLVKNFYGLTLVINQQTNYHSLTNALMKSFTSIWLKFTLNCKTTNGTYHGSSNPSFHRVKYNSIICSEQVIQFFRGGIQELPIEQTMALTIGRREIVMSTPLLNMPGSIPASLRGNALKFNNICANRYDPLCTTFTLDGFASLPHCREWYANTQWPADCDSFNHVIGRDEETFDQMLYQRNLAFNNSHQFHQSKVKFEQMQQDRLHMQHESEDTTKQEILKLNISNNGYGKQQNSNNNSSNNNSSNSTQSNGTSNRGGGRGNGRESQGGSNSCRGQGRDQGSASGSGGDSGDSDEGHNGDGNRRSGNGSHRSGSNKTTQDSEDTSPVLQPELNHCDRQPTIYHSLSLAASNENSMSYRSEDSSCDSTDFHEATGNTNFHPAEESSIDEGSVLVIGVAKVRPTVSYHLLPFKESTPDDGNSQLAIASNLYHRPQSPLLSSNGLSLSSNNVFHISKISTYMFPSENPVPHHVNSHYPLLQAVTDNIIDTATVSHAQSMQIQIKLFGCLQFSAGPIAEVDEQYISTPQISCPAEVMYLKSPIHFYATLGTGGNTVSK